ncbi:hypothetical protein AB1A65_03950 [Muricauda sp. ANG21]|uniref:hypothetical protein n=1 Tax=Allomuricauda sp. ANG21 TaxID=3042468 RepID=UPI003456D6E6
MILDDYIYNYYPKGIEDVFSDEYTNSIEYKSLKKAIQNAEKSETINEIKEILKSYASLDSLKMKFLDSTNFSFNDRAFNFQYRQELPNKIIKTVCCNISVLLPIYCIYYIERDFSKVVLGDKVDTAFYKYDFNTFPSSFKGLKIKISETLNNIGLKRIENKILEKRVPGIGFNNIGYNNMTRFNCLFLDEPYVSP